MTKTPIKLEFEASGIAGKVDREKGIIRGVSIITSGVTAKGHNLEVDATTLTQMKDLGEKAGKVPAKWNHRTGADAVNGHFFNFRIVGRKLKADWKLLKAHPQYEQALELAEVQPETVGLSASFMGENEAKGGKEYARCSELLSVDLVATAAANPDGLFEARVDTPPGGMAKTIPAPGAIPDNNEPVTLEALMGALTGMRGEITGLAQRVTNFETRFDAALDDEEEEEEVEEEEEEEETEEVDPTEFKSFGDVVTFFERRLDAARDEQERQEFAAAFGQLEHDFEALTELNEQLRGENLIMATAIQELEAKTKTKVELSAGTDGNPIVQFSRTDGGKLTEFEARVKQLQAGGKEYAEALLAAQSEDAGRYQKHLEAKGVFAKSL